MASHAQSAAVKHKRTARILSSHNYSIYGVTLETEERFPELALLATKKSGPANKIFVGRQSKLSLSKNKKRWNSFYGLDYWLDSRRRLAVIQSPTVGVFRINFEKRRIDWAAARKISHQFIHAILRARILGFAVSHATPSLLLHASVVVRGGQGVAIGGVIAEGKSTLTAACLSKGFSLLSDDIAVIRKKQNRFILYPGAPEFRLWPKTARQFQKVGMHGVRLSPEVKKQKFLLGPKTAWRFTKKPVPLRVVYILSRKKGDGKIQIENLSGQEALTEILKCFYNPIMEQPGVLRHHFEMAVQVARHVPIKRLVYPSGFDKLDAVRNAIVRDLKR